MPVDKSKWDTQFGDDGTIELEDGTVIDISDTTIDQMMSSIEAVVDKELEGNVQGKLRKGSGQNIRVDLDKRDVAWAARIVELRLDPRFPTRANIIRHGLRVGLREISKNHKSGALDRFIQQDRARRELEEVAEVSAEQHQFFTTLRQNVAMCYGDPERIIFIRQSALRYYISGITEWQKEQLKSIFPGIEGLDGSTGNNS